MGREISLFSDFHKDENRVTNYCGLILKMMYQERPEAFQDVMISLLGDKNNGFDILPSFRQQEAKNSGVRSVPDLILQQNSFAVYFEVKTTDWFHGDQIVGHLKNLSEEKSIDNKILFLLTNEFNKTDERCVEDSVKKAGVTDIIVQTITFEEFLQAVRSAMDSYIRDESYVATAIAEFEDYLNRSGRLPMWKHTVDIIPCGATVEEVENGIYICPAKGGSYHHERAAFFGAYWDKKIQYLARISGIVILSKKDDECGYECEVQWGNAEVKEDELKNEAKKRFEAFACTWRDEELNKTSLRVFVLDDMKKVEITKESKGGIRAKVYWRDVEAESVDALADELKQRKW